MHRRTLLTTAAAALIARPGPSRAEPFEITRTEQEWRARLTPAEFEVMRNDGTERAGSSPLDKETAKGIYHCKGCDLAVYASDHKYDSKTGWPSFWQSLDNAVRTKPDNGFFITRTEVHCRRCGSHLGHIFDDGPPPTGKRHCLNGISLVFRPA
jgi:peptide-methionine (R)-S-oxide reductase